MIARILRLLSQRRNPASELARIGHNQRRQRIRLVCDDMRRQMGLEPVRWPE